MTEPPNNPFKLFYCYAHEDKVLRDTLDRHLSGLKRQKLLEIWYDREISPGMEWEDQIDKHLSSADIVLLLVSAAFLASDYCYGKEMAQALQMHEEGMARVVPIILRPVDWKIRLFANCRSYQLKQNLLQAGRIVMVHTETLQQVCVRLLQNYKHCQRQQRDGFKKARLLGN